MTIFNETWTSETVYDSLYGFNCQKNYCKKSP